MTLSLFIGAALALQLPPQEVETRLAECGIARPAVTWGVDAYFGEPEARIAGASGSFQDAALLCAIEAASRAGYSARFADETAEARAQALWRARASAEMRQTARAWLGERNLLGRLADYDPERQTLASYARSLEAMCGLAPGAVLAADEPTASEPGVLTIVAGATGPGDGVLCLFNAFFASNLAERGAIIGMLGRDAEPVQR